MSITDKWTWENYLKHIVDNKLDIIWTGYCNPKGTEGIRLVAYTPIFPENGDISYFERKCTKKGCDGKLIIPLDDVVHRIIYKKKCNGTINGSACGTYKTILYRWAAINDKTKLHFDNTNIVRHYGKIGRTFYATNMLYDHKIVRPKSMYVDQQLVKACSLTMDIDIKMGTICESRNKQNMGLALDILREELDTICPGSYNIQTSGNGVYIILHHLLCDTDVFAMCAMYNNWIHSYLNPLLKQKLVKGIKVDPINMPSRVFKLFGSIHQTKDLVCIPLEHDVKFDNIDNAEFKLKNFNINKYIVNGKLNFYNRFDKNDKKPLYDFLNDNTYRKGSSSNFGTYDYGFKESVEVITGEKQEIEEIGEIEKVDEKQAERLRLEQKVFYNEHIGWKQIDGTNGKGIIRDMKQGILEIEFEGMGLDDARTIVDKIMNEKATKNK